MSLGGGGFNQAAQDVYDEVRAAGVIIIAAAGNDASDRLGYLPRMKVSCQYRLQAMAQGTQETRF